jgi:hypothetical protein
VEENEGFKNLSCFEDAFSILYIFDMINEFGNTKKKKDLVGNDEVGG